MKASTLLTELNKANAILKNTYTNEILSENGKLYIKDYETMLVLNINLGFNAIIPAKPFITIIKNLGDKQIEITCDHLYVIHIMIKNSTSSFKIIANDNFDEFKKIEIVTEELEIDTLTKTDINNIGIATNFINPVSKYASNDVFNYVWINKMIVGTDRSVMFYRRRLSSPYVPYNVSTQSYKIFKNENTIHVFSNDAQLIFKSVNLTIITPSPTEKQPNYLSVIPTDSTVKIVLMNKTLLNTVQLVAIASNVITKEIDFEYLSNRLKVSTTNYDTGTDYEETVAVANIGQELLFKKRLNADNLKKVLGAINPSELVEIKTNIENNKAVIINDEFILMPIMPRKEIIEHEIDEENITNENNAA